MTENFRKNKSKSKKKRLLKIHKKQSKYHQTEMGKMEKDRNEEK